MKAEVTYKMEDLIVLVQQQVDKDFPTPEGYKWDVCERYSQVQAELVKIESPDYAENQSEAEK
jgi:hypothetical protein